ncbi:MAG: hypothetical protein WC727_08600 [Ignavibacteriaceae bacterium]|jgi:hypothetical protein
MEFSTFVLIIFCMLMIVNIIYSLILYPQLKEADEELDNDS